MTNSFGVAAIISAAFSLISICYSTYDIKWTTIELSHNRSVIAFSPRENCFFNGTKNEDLNFAANSFRLPWDMRKGFECFSYDKINQARYYYFGEHAVEHSSAYDLSRKEWTKLGYLPNSWCYPAIEDHRPTNFYFDSNTAGNCQMQMNLCKWFSVVTVIFLSVSLMTLVSSLYKVNGFPHLAQTGRSLIVCSLIMTVTNIGVWVHYSNTNIRLHPAATTAEEETEKSFGSGFFSMIHAMLFLLVAAVSSHRFALFQQFRIQRHLVPTEEPDPLHAPPSYKVTELT